VFGLQTPTPIATKLSHKEPLGFVVFDVVVTLTTAPAVGLAQFDPTVGRGDRAAKLLRIHEGLDPQDGVAVVLLPILTDAADLFRANSGLKAQEYSAPALGLIFLRFAVQRAELEKSATSSRRGSRMDEPAAYHAEGILTLPAEARFDYLLNLVAPNVWTAASLHLLPAHICATLRGDERTG